MTKFITAFFVASLALPAQTFQPSSWAQQSSMQEQMEKLRSLVQSLQTQHTQQSSQHFNQHIEAQIGPVTGHPVSGKEIRHSSQTLADGTVIDQGSNVSSFYRDASGRMRDESPNRVEIFDNVGQVEYDMDPAKKTYTKLPLSGHESYIAVAVFGGTSYTSTSSDPHYGAHQEAGVSEDLGIQVINGVTAKHSRVTVTIPTGAIGNNRDIKVTNDRWYSEDLQLLIKSVNKDPRFGVNEYELTDMIQAAPDPLLFMPPPDYTQVASGHR